MLMRQCDQTRDRDGSYFLLNSSLMILTRRRNKTTRMNILLARNWNKLNVTQKL